MTGLHSWGDESVRTTRIAQPSYLLGAVVADSAACDEFRRALRSLHRRGPKLHWHDQDSCARRESIATIAEFDVYHIVVIAAPIDVRRQERARALCLERLAWHLDEAGVQVLTLEARPPQLMRRDIRTIDALRSKHALPSGLRIDHEKPSVEPMLWVADQVLGALGESLTGGGSEWFDTVRARTTIVSIEP